MKTFMKTLKPYEEVYDKHISRLTDVLGLERQIEFIATARRRELNGIWIKYITVPLDYNSEGDAAAVLLPVMQFALANRTSIIRSIFWDLRSLLNRLEQGVYDDALDELRRMFLAHLEGSLERVLMDLSQVPVVQEELAKFRPPPAEQKRQRVQACIACGIQAKQLCAVCKKAAYCGEACQLAHWSDHSKKCFQ